MLRLTNGREYTTSALVTGYLKWLSHAGCSLDHQRYFDTDHRLLVMDVSFQKTKRELKFKLSRAVTSAAPKPSLDLHSLRKDPKLQKKLSDYLDTALSGVNVMIWMNWIR